MQKAGWVKNRIVGAALACALVAGVLGATTASVAAAASPVSPSSIDITSGGVCSTSGSATYPISINLPTPYVNSNVDVALLLDDTGSFSGEWSSVASTFSSVVDQLQADAPGVSFGFGVSMFKDYGGAWTAVDEDDQQSRPFILNQPIITASTAGSASALDTDVSNAVSLANQLPGSGGDGPEASLEGLHQLATGFGFDGNDNGSDLDSGSAGALTTEKTPGDSGDVPPFSSNVAPTSGSLGGIGWRPGALHIAIVATDTSPVAAFPAGSPIPTTITSANGDSEPSINFAYSSLTPGDNRTGYVANTTDPATNTVAGAVAPTGAATVQGTVNALNGLGVRVLGMGPGDAPTSAEGPGGNSSSIWLSSMARLTGATDASGNPLVFDTNVDPNDLAKAIVSNIQTSAAKPVNVGFTTSGLPSGLSVSFSPNVVDSVAPGSTASTTATIKATGSSHNGAFDINFVDASSGAELGSIPVTVACASQPSGKIHTTSSPNWAGYDAKLKTVTDIHATWQVPAVSCSGSSKKSEMSMWGGIDDKSSHLVQAGTAAYCSGKTATPTYYAWWESLPAAETPVAYVKPGDEMSLDISYHVGPAAYFIILLTDDSQKVIDQTVVVNHEPLSEAECIVEAPTQPHRVLGLKFENPTQLADFGTATFTDCDVTNSNVDNQQIGLGSVNGLTVHKINMTDTFRDKASTGNPSPGGIPWTVTWRHPD